MKMKTVKYTAIITASVIVPIVFLYLSFAFVLWSMKWPSECTSVDRVLFVLLLVALLLVCIPSAAMTIEKMEK